MGRLIGRGARVWPSLTLGLKLRRSSDPLGNSKRVILHEYCPLFYIKQMTTRKQGGGTRSSIISRFIYDTYRIRRRPQPSTKYQPSYSSGLHLAYWTAPWNTPTAGLAALHAQESPHVNGNICSCADFFASIYWYHRGGKTINGGNSIASVSQNGPSKVNSMAGTPGRSTWVLARQGFHSLVSPFWGSEVSLVLV